MSEKKSRGTGRTRSWTFILYPESAPENWREIIDEFHIQWVESPLHDKDIDVDDTQKKPHWHILLMFESVKDYEQVKEISDKLVATIPQKCNGAKGLVRYMAHLDNPEKVQYSIADIIGHGGVDIAELLKPNASERYVLIREMIVYAKQNGITEMCDLVEYAMTERFDDWFPLLCDNSAYIMGTVIKSYRHRVERVVQPAIMVKVDKDSGEILY